jgi:hypothetical protein
MIFDPKSDKARPEGVSIPADIRDFLQKLSDHYAQHETDLIMNMVSDSFLHQGLNKWRFESCLRRSYIFKHLNYLKITILKIKIEQNIAELVGFGESDLGVVPASDPFLPLMEGTKLIREGKEWKLLGNQIKYITGLYNVFHQLSAYFIPSDTTLYRSLLPKLLNIPSKPEVFVKITDFEQTKLPLTPYLVAHVQILAEYKGLQGWYTLTMPESEWIPVEMGKTIGYPKYVCDSIKFERNKNGWKAEMINTGDIDLYLSLDYVEDNSQANWFERMTGKYPLSLIRKLMPPFKEKPWFLIMPLKSKYPGESELILKGDPLISGIPNVSENFGKVRIYLKTNQPWGALFQEEFLARGIFMNFAGSLILRHNIIEPVQENYQ